MPTYVTYYGIAINWNISWKGSWQYKLIILFNGPTAAAVTQHVKAFFSHDEEVFEIRSRQT